MISRRCDPARDWGRLGSYSTERWDAFGCPGVLRSGCCVWLGIAREEIGALRACETALPGLWRIVLDFRARRRIGAGPETGVVTDLIVGMERAKTSNWGGRPVRMNTILASTDVVAIDAVSAQLIGLNPDDVEYLTLAGMWKVGVADPDRIEVRGEDLDRISRNPAAT